jgi:wyosine [tRNA(Phe)-imidazoG37] synthetase (radical SAM superfamily)
MPAVKYVFGPVPSRRLGRSLGIDPTPPPDPLSPARVGPYDRHRAPKACDWNCVYCQLGPTRPFTRSRSSFFPPEALFAELRGALDSGLGDGVDWITFVGSGEPSLNKDLGALIDGVKAASRIPIAVITNGSLLSLPEVRSELLRADAVMPTLDAGSPSLFRRINRPPSEFGFERQVEGLAAFGREYSGKLWLETMLISGLNDDEASLRDLAAAIERVEPDEVHLVLPTRPPSEAWVHPADPAAILRAKAILGSAARVVLPDQRYGGFGCDRQEDHLAAAAAIVERHPMSLEELQAALESWGAAAPDSLIRELVASGKAIEVERGGVTFLRGRGKAT